MPTINGIAEIAAVVTPQRFSGKGLQSALSLMLILCAVRLRAAENKPVLGPGATREEVIDTYGWPNGQSQSGEREIFSYQQGRVVLKDGVVERMDFSPNVTWPVPRPRPKTSTAAQTRTLAPEKSLVVDPWLTDFSAAQAEAEKRQARILALFTGVDWSPASKKFQDEVALSPEFIATVAREYVLLRLDFPRTTTQAPATHQQNAELRERFHVTIYPSALLLTSKGEEYGRVDLSKARPHSTYREQVIAAIEEANPTPTSATWLASPAPAPAAVAVEVPPLASRRFWLILGACALLAVAAVRGWWRRRHAVEAAPEPQAVLPTVGEIAAWPHVRLRNVCSQLFGAEGKRVDVRASQSGADLIVQATAERGASKALVRCLSGVIGAADLSSTRDLLGTMIAEGVQSGWYVAPAGFAAEARAFAIEHGILPVTGEDLRQRLESLSAPTLTHVLAPTPAPR